ncbi:MAG: SDR family NAD(P)-dependent oxidoreductase [Bdellovibrio sp.]
MLKKCAFVTGASAGIGEATARRLASEGYSLIIGGRRKDRLETLQDELKRHGNQIRIAPFDLQSRSSIEDFCRTHEDWLSEVTVLVNNAGLARGTEKVQDANIDDWDIMIDTNVKGLLTVTRRVLPHLLKQERGHIVNVGSVAGRWVYPGGAVYCASKFAVRAISEGLRMDLAGKNIRVTNIEPGMVETEFSVVRLGNELKAKAVYQGMTPLSADDIAETISWCLARPGHVNIQEIVIYPTDQAHVGQVHRT